MRLVTNHSVRDMRAGCVQPVGQFDVGFLIEARTQFDDDRDLFPTTRRVYQRVHDDRVGACAVKRLFDSQHVLVGGCLSQQFYNWRKRFERVMQQQK